ncbi:MAG TPA: HdeD family acid-resistance protein [Streptosporangiaceae bacterium]|nr:HdeD family acid-resistance protein [Streptosporangiaceae bacterium]
MSDPLRYGDTLARVGRHWGWVLAYGIITMIAGIAALAWPGETLLVVAVLFGIQLIVSGIFRFGAALASDDLTGGTRVLLAFLGVLSVIVGLWAVRHVLLTLLALVVLLGIFWVVNGAIELFTALSRREMPERGWTALMGLLSVVAGIIVLAYPGFSLVGLAAVLGVWLLILGAMEITAAYRLRQAGQIGQRASRLLGRTH